MRIVLEGDYALLFMHKGFNKFSNVEWSPEPLTEVPKEKFTGEEFGIENLNWKKAEQRFLKNTTAGPVEIPVNLMNQLGPQDKAQLAQPSK